MELTIEQVLKQGMTAHKEGDLQEAERLYRAILKSQPTPPDANYNLGVLGVVLATIATGVIGLIVYNSQIYKFLKKY